MSSNEKAKVTFEEIKVKSNQLVDKVRELIQEGNARRVTINKDDRTLLEFPLSLGVGGAAAAIMFTPVLAAVGALAALVSDVDIVVERSVIAEIEVADDVDEADEESEKPA